MPQKLVLTIVFDEVDSYKQDSLPLRYLKVKTPLRNKKGTQIKFCKVMAVPTLLYGSKTWVLSKKDTSHIPVSYTHLDVYKRQP